MAGPNWGCARAILLSGCRLRSPSIGCRLAITLPCVASVVAGAGNSAVVPDMASESGLAGCGVLIRCSWWTHGWIMHIYLVCDTFSLFLSIPGCYCCRGDLSLCVWKISRHIWTLMCLVSSSGEREGVHVHSSRGLGTVGQVCYGSGWGFVRQCES